MMMANDICIATISWARNEDEETVLRKSLSQLATLSVPVFITDGGSAPSFVAFLQSLPTFHVLQAEKKGVQAQAKNSLLAAYAANTPYVFYTEPDKEEFFRSGLPTMLSNKNLDDAVGIYLAARSAEGFASFPPFQQMTETTINNCCAEVIEQSFDFTYGPFLLRRQLIPYLHQLSEDVGWGWRPYLFSIAHRLNLEIKSFTADFVCPQEQRKDDRKERLYRMKQLEQNIRGIVHSTTIDL